MNEPNNPNKPEDLKEPENEAISRRDFFSKLSLGLGGVCTAMIGAPVVGFVLAPLFQRIPHSWIPLGDAGDYEIGKTVKVSFMDPSPLPWAGITANTAAWLRRDGPEQFTVFSVYCTHLGCPVRWLQDSELFLCPCHGGAYYKDGSVAAGPPPKPLIRYEVRIVQGRVEIKAAPIPITTSL